MKTTVATHAPGASARTWSPSLVHAGAALAGLLLGTAAAIYSYDRIVSWSLAAFVFILVTYTVGRGGARVLTQPRKIHRTLYFALLPALATALLLGSYALWGQLPLSVVLGLLAGSLLHGPLGRRLVPSVAHDERWSAP
jgi:hypothetical protein